MSDKNKPKRSPSFPNIMTASSKKPGSDQNMNAASSGNVRVVCRFRPLNNKELSMGMAENVCIDFIDKQTVSMKNVHEGLEKQKFIFDMVFPMASNQFEVYNFAAKPVIESVLEGFNGTVFAYGQTSSGKTHTMQGPNIEDEKLKGIIPRMVTTVFENIDNSPDHIEFKIKVTLVEIYMERIRDLLDISKVDLKIREDKTRGIYIDNVTESYVAGEEDVYSLMKAGNSNRAISATNMNEGSSRSHSIFILTISQNNLSDLSAKTGKLFLVDLAGSEKISKTGATGQTLDEAKKINKSLSSLGNVINALTDGKSAHIPYRDSKLTRILQESLGGNSRTTLIITCSPSPFNEAETLSTLRFGIRAKSIKNKPKINRELTVAELQILLSKANKTISEREERIKQLEDYIKNMGKVIPEENLIQLNKEKDEEIKEDEVEEDDHNDFEGSSQKSDGKIEIAPFDSGIQLEKINEDNELTKERIKNLEDELNTERNNVKTQTEKLNHLRKEFAVINAKSITQEKESEDLIHKITEMTLKNEEIEEIIKEKDERIEQLEELKNSFITEIDSLKKNKDSLIKIIEQKNQEIENIEEKYILKQKNAVSESVQTNLKEILLDMPENKYLTDEKAQNYEDILYKYIYDENRNSEIIERFSHSIKPISQEEKQNKSKEELLIYASGLESKLEKEKYTHENLKKEFDEVKDTLKKVISNKLPSLDDFKQKIKQDITKTYENERLGLLGDLQKRTDKITHLEVVLTDEKEKYKILESSMSNGEKSLKKKVTGLEKNVEDLTMMYHQLIANINNLKNTNQNFEKKLKKKVESIVGLKKQESELRDSLNIYKSKYESLKAMFNQNGLGDGKLLYNNKDISPETKKEEESASIYSSNKYNNPLPIFISQNKNIVKTIKGGHVKKNSQFKEMISSQNKTVSTMLPISGEYKIETKKND